MGNTSLGNSSLEGRLRLKNQIDMDGPSLESLNLLESSTFRRGKKEIKNPCPGKATLTEHEGFERT